MKKKITSKMRACFRHPERTLGGITVGQPGERKGFYNTGDLNEHTGTSENGGFPGGVVAQIWGGKRTGGLCSKNSYPSEHVHVLGQKGAQDMVKKLTENRKKGPQSEGRGYWKANGGHRVTP